MRAVLSERSLVKEFLKGLQKHLLVLPRGPSVIVFIRIGPATVPGNNFSPTK